MQVRPIGPDDAGAWAEMRGRLWPDAAADALAAEARAFVDDGEQSALAAAFIAADTDGRALGFIELAIRAFSDGCDSMPVPHIEGWYVKPSVRRQGIGRALLNAAEEWAVARGFVELASDTETHNVASQDAHAQCGFEEVDRLVKFRKRLTSS
jgi:aminoglycoside 6'-N-acetyltransferase I